MSEPSKLRAAVNQLRKEREDIINAAVEAGTAVRVPVSVTQHGGSLEQEKERVTEELRRKGEKREIYFDECTIFTGVPRAPEYFQRSGTKVDQPIEKPRTRPEGEALRAPDALRAQYQPPQVSDIPSMERSRLQTTVQLPNATALQGEVASGFFLVRDGVLFVEDMHGRLLGRQALQPSDNAEAIARRILRDKSGGGNDFYKRLQYPPNSIH